MELITHSIGVMSERQLLDILFELMDVVSSNKNVKFHTAIETDKSSTVKNEFIISNNKTNRSIFILRRHEKSEPDDEIEFSSIGMEMVSTTIDKDYNFEKEFPQLNIILQKIKCDLSHK